MNDDDVSPFMRSAYHSFVCTTLVLLLGFQAYDYFWQTEDLDTDVTDVKFVVMQLTRGLSEVNRKHESLRNEIDRMAAVLPSAAAAASRAQEAMQAACNYRVQDAGDYDRKLEANMLPMLEILTLQRCVKIPNPQGTRVVDYDLKLTNPHLK